MTGNAKPGCGRMPDAPYDRWMLARTSTVVVVVVCAGVLSLGYGIKATCAGPSQPALYPGVCYTDIQWDRGLYRPGAVPYVNRFVEYPALTGTFMWGTAKLASIAGFEERRPSDDRASCSP